MPILHRQESVSWGGCCCCPMASIITISVVAVMMMMTKTPGVCNRSFVRRSSVTGRRCLIFFHAAHPTRYAAQRSVARVLPACGSGRLVCAWVFLLCSLAHNNDERNKKKLAHAFSLTPSLCLCLCLSVSASLPCSLEWLLLLLVKVELPQ